MTATSSSMRIQEGFEGFHGTHQYLLVSGWENLFKKLENTSIFLCNKVACITIFVAMTNWPIRRQDLARSLQIVVTQILLRAK